MPPRAKKATNDEEEPGILLSQNSNGSNSDDVAQELIAAVEEKMREKQNKKRREAEKNFLQDLQEELDKSFSASEHVLHTLGARETQIFDKFLLQNAACDDKIHKLRCQMIEEQRKIVNMVAKDKEDLNTFLKEVEDLQFRALAKVERGCQDDYEQALGGLRIEEWTGF